MKKLTIILLFVCFALQGQVPFFVNSNNYETDTSVQIGTQIWMKYNLNVSYDNNDTYIPNVTDAVTWAALTTCARCYRDNDSTTYAGIYGALYNYYCAEENNLCPEGWELPTKNDLDIFYSYLDNKFPETSGYVLKVDGSNIYNFNSYATEGARRTDGSFDIIMHMFWSSDLPYRLTIWQSFNYLSSSSLLGINYGVSIRCIKK